MVAAGVGAGGVAAAVPVGDVAVGAVAGGWFGVVVGSNVGVAGNVGDGGTAVGRLPLRQATNNNANSSRNTTFLAIGAYRSTILWIVTEICEVEGRVNGE